MPGFMSALINARDATAFAARSAPPPCLRGVGFLLESIPASLPHVDSRVPAALWCSSPASLMEMKLIIKKGPKSGSMLLILALLLLCERWVPRCFGSSKEPLMSADKSLRDVSHCQGCLSSPRAGQMIYATLPKSKQYFGFGSSS